jgi:putative tryptophan/tyrosine transport system substrate-binding protein
MIKRREFIAGLGVAAAWPVVVRAQQGERVRRIGVLIAGVQNDRGRQVDMAALREGLAKLGWIEGRNLRIDLRFGTGDPEYTRAAAAELVDLAPDVMVTNVSTTRVVQEQTQTIPIVIATGGDPVANGLIQNIARPEGNITGFISNEPSMAGKCLELLREAAPRVTRVASIFNPELTPTAASYLSAIETAAPAFGVQAITTTVRNAVDIVRAIDAFAAEPNGGLLVLPPLPTPALRETILQLTAEHRLPSIFIGRDTVGSGFLLSYGGGGPDLYRSAASYVDRLLRGTKVSELPVQLPTKYNLVINLKTAKALGLTVPQSILLRADEVIE